METYDTIIIGGGPGGLTASLYACRSGMNTLLIEKAFLGGRAVEQHNIENYPGYPQGVSGMELIEKMKEQSKKFGAKIVYDEVKKISKENKIFLLKGNNNNYLTETIIIATGSTPKKLNIPGEEEYGGKGVSYCATCDGPFFKDKVLIVVGGGNTALEEALYLTKFAKEIHLVHRRDRFRGDKILQNRVFSTKKISTLFNSIVLEIKGTDSVKSVIISSTKDNTHQEIKCDGIFIYVGSKANTNFLENFLELDENGYIITGEDMKTSVEGIFACGDVRSKKLRQIVTACAEGAIAAHSAEKYLSLIKGTFYE